MLKLFSLFFFLLFITGCDKEKPKVKLDAQKLLTTKCASCHDINLPPIISDTELAPPMMAVAFHISNFMKPPVESQRTAMATAFVVDYVREPSLEKSYCDKESLQRYGLMPSQKENVSDDETRAIADYMFSYYTQENLAKVQKAQAAYDTLEIGEKIALKHRCLGCHKVDKKIVGPSLRSITKRYQDDIQSLKNSITNGSQKRWDSSNGAVMPAFKNINKKELDELTKWILTHK